MITTDGTTIERNNHNHKFGRCGFTEYLYLASLDDGSASVGGSDFGLWAQQLGKRVLMSDDQGNVWHVRYDTEALAQAAIEEIETQWHDWTDDATCNQCANNFANEEGTCWTCGSRDWSERQR
ncbi:MAG: hypothetical protein GY941_09885 [Planctomycetes bacterium]|nr:hypothetical protein [Planctomycetota bacterium]